MANARRIRLEAEMPFREAAQRTVQARGPELLETVEAARQGDDIEALHDLRVAARRLRAVLEVYEQALPAKAHRRALKLVRATGDASNAARDLDVQIAFLQEFAAAATPSDRPGVQTLVKELQRLRAAAAAALHPALDRLDRHGELEHAIGALVAPPPPPPPPPAPPPDAAR
jgi:CHAD domain-containing protein